MGYVINVEADMTPQQAYQLKDYLKGLVRDATGEKVSRVITHGALSRDEDEIRRQLNALRRQQ